MRPRSRSRLYRCSMTGWIVISRIGIMASANPDQLPVSVNGRDSASAQPEKRGQVDGLEVAGELFITDQPLHPAAGLDQPPAQPVP